MGLREANSWVGYAKIFIGHKKKYVALLVKPLLPSTDLSPPIKRIPRENNSSEDIGDNHITSNTSKGCLYLNNMFSIDI